MNVQLPITVDMAELTLRDLAELGDVLGAPLSTIMEGADQARGIAAVAFIMARRQDPTFTMDDALNLRMMKDLIVVNNTGDDADPKAESGATHQSSPVHGA